MSCEGSPTRLELEVKIAVLDGWQGGGGGDTASRSLNMEHSGRCKRVLWVTPFLYLFVTLRNDGGGMGEGVKLGLQNMKVLGC